mgnify:CR=1 FL=1
MGDTDEGSSSAAQGAQDPNEAPRQGLFRKVAEIFTGGGTADPEQSEGSDTGQAQPSSEADIFASIERLGKLHADELLTDEEMASDFRVVATQQAME